jgi:hypothetical protein
MSISIPKRLLREPFLSESTLLHIEDALDCDGLECLGQEDSYGYPHRHLVVLGVRPDAGPRCYPVE